MFPYKKARPGQKEFMEDVSESIKTGKNLIAHAPTGIGKTAGALAPAVEYALKNDKTVFFLTSRHSQHLMAMQTLKEMNKKRAFVASDLIGKKHICSVPGIKGISSADFSSYCSYVREKGNCEFYNRTRSKKGLKKDAKEKVKELLSKQPLDTEQVKERCRLFCPYEITLELMRKSQAVVCDYFHIFCSPELRILNRIGKKLEDSIIIVDEAHNLPERLRSILSRRLSTYIIRNAIKEATSEDLEKDLKQMLKEIKELGENVVEECIIPKQVLIRKIRNYDELIENLKDAADIVMKEKKTSFMGSIASFLEAWKGEDEGFSRILHKHEEGGKVYLSLDYTCLDPSAISSSIIKEAHSTILMSGTMKPMEMYLDLLGMDNAQMKEYKSDFPEEKRLNLIFPEVTTKYKERHQEQYEKISWSIKKCIDSIPGNSIIYFPSYQFMHRIYDIIKIPEILEEQKFWKKRDREKVIRKFRNGENRVMFAVMGGSFSEGIDLPGKALKGVIIVGVPLAKPDLYIKSLIDYYKQKFNNGWDYAYTYPALIKVIQATGRVIRSKRDMGVVVLMDKRYLYPKYSRLFSELTMKITSNPEKEIKQFFK